MEIKLRKLMETTPEVSIENGVMTFKVAGFSAQKDAANDLLYVYYCGYEIEIPEGFVGIQTPVKDIAVKSLIASTSPTILTPGKHAIGDVMRPVASIPAIFVDSEDILTITVVPYNTVSTLNIEEYVAPVIENVDIDNLTGGKESIEKLSETSFIPEESLTKEEIENNNK